MTQQTEAFHPLWELTLTRFREFVREPEALFWVFAFPVVMTCALGVAFRSGDTEPISVGVVRGARSQQVAGALHAAGGFIVRDLGTDEVERAVRDGRAQVVVEASEPPVYHFDASRPESHAARMAVDAALQRAAGRADAFTPEERPVESIGSRYIDWLVPGLLGMNIMGTGMWSVSFSIVNARVKKLLKRLIATPMSRAHYLASHVLSRFAFLGLESGLLIGFAWVAFGVTVRGSLVSVAVIAVLGSLCFGGIALLVSSRARTIEGMSGLINLVMVPMWIFSGVFFASSNFPDAMQPIIQALPLTALNDALRGVINEGDSLAAVGHELAILGGWGVSCFLLALKLFRWQ